MEKQNLPSDYAPLDRQLVEQLEAAVTAAEARAQAAETRASAAEARASAIEVERDTSVRELEDIARFLSHDLRAPLRGIDGYSKALIEDYGGQLDEIGHAYLHYIADSGRLAASVVDKLIHYIRVPRATLVTEPIDLSDQAFELTEILQTRFPGRSVSTDIQPGLTVQADARLVRLLMECLLENAWKFTCHMIEAHIEVGRGASNGPDIYFVRDDGAGFDMAYITKMFQPFQRLHSAHEFEGAGMGLAVSRRIVERHGGQIWATGKPDNGAAFYFTLEAEKPD